MTIHKTVLLNEAVQNLKLEPGMVAIDATLGGGGHSTEILKKIGEVGTLIVIDQDEEALKRFSTAFYGKNIILVHDNFARLESILADLKIEKVDAILADLGISSDQLEDKTRGISFQEDAFLDMRMDRSKGMTAAQVINTYGYDDLKKILAQLGNEQYAGKIAKNIINQRNLREINRTGQLVEIIEQSVPASYKRKRINCATKTFQALRMEVNQELESLDAFLSQAVETLKPGGRLAIITFHSGEDSMVKNRFRENARGCICPPELPVCRCGRKPIVKLVNKKPILPSANEIEKNPRARSAKLRVIEKI